MPGFTVQQIETIANSALDFYMDKRKVHAQTIQDKPLLKAMRAAEKTFPGGKESLSVAVKFDYSTSVQGFVNDDSVGYTNPANTKRANYPWKLLHAGIQFTMDELIRDGISVTDSVTGKNVSQHSDRELTALVNILDEKLDDMSEGIDRSMNRMYWLDGTQDSKVIPGITSIIVDTPSAATAIGGIDPVSNPKWRNRANLAISGVGTPADQPVVITLQRELRQLKRYGSSPNLWLAGSDMIEQIEKELRAKGNYTDSGWMSKGKTDAGMADISFKGNSIEYDPELDDMGWSKRLYVIDTKDVYPMVVEGENWKKQNPARPAEKYVFYRAQTYVGGMVAKKRNGCGVYGFA